MQKSAHNPDGEILHFVRRTGRAEMDEHAAPVNASEYILSMNPDMRPAAARRSSSRLLKELRDEVPGVDIEVEQPLAHLISHMVSGVYAQIAIKVRRRPRHAAATGRAGQDGDSETCRASRRRSSSRSGRPTNCTSGCGPTTWPSTD